MNTTRPIFIVGSGRSGTAALAKLLGGVPGVEMHHEYLCTHVQPVAARYAMGLADAAEVRGVIEACHGAAIRLSNAPVWGDSSNKLSWIIPILAELYPLARFAHVVRDGRKVASSFFHKLGDECYDDASVAALAAWAEGGAAMPPPEKRYWWPLPLAGHPAHAAFGGFDQFRRIAFHWAEINRTVLEASERLPAKRSGCSGSRSWSPTPMLCMGCSTSWTCPIAATWPSRFAARTTSTGRRTSC